MPNWCNNEISICGPSAKIIYETIINEQNKKKEKKENFVGFMALFVPSVKQDSDEEEADEEEADDDWYENNSNTWGTKWDIDVDELESEMVFNESNKSNNHNLNFIVRSAWSPINLFLEKLVKKYPDLSITNLYYEEGCDFFGRFECDIDTNDDESFTYYEGMYYLAIDRFWDNLEYYFESNSGYSLPSLLKTFNFLENEDVDLIIQKYNEYHNSNFTKEEVISDEDDIN